MPRRQAPALLYRVQDVLVQPSDEERLWVVCCGGSGLWTSGDCGPHERKRRLFVFARHSPQRRSSGDVGWGAARIEPAEDSKADGGIRAIRRCAEEHFSLETVTTRLIEILESVIAPRRG